MKVCFGFLICFLIFACASMPEPKVTHYDFPKNAFVGDVKRPYIVLGPVKSKVNFQTLDPNHDEEFLCQNYYNQAVKELVKFGKEKGADAVIDVKSVVFYEDGSSGSFKTPECSDEGAEGQVLAAGIAVRWKPVPSPTPKN